MKTIDKRMFKKQVKNYSNIFTSEKEVLLLKIKKVKALLTDKKIKSLKRIMIEVNK